MSDWKTMQNGPEKYNRYLASREWAKVRDVVHARANGACERCGRHPIQAVHHLTYIRIYNEHPDDLKGYCRHCHAYTHNKSDFDPKADECQMPGPDMDAVVALERRLLRLMIDNPIVRVHAAGMISASLIAEPVHWHVMRALEEIGADVIEVTPEFLHERTAPYGPVLCQDIDAIFATQLEPGGAEAGVELINKYLKVAGNALLASALSVYAQRILSVDDEPEHHVRLLIRAFGPSGLFPRSFYEAACEGMQQIENAIRTGDNDFGDLLKAKSLDA